MIAQCSFLNVESFLTIVFSFISQYLITKNDIFNGIAYTSAAGIFKLEDTNLLANVHVEHAMAIVTC